MQISKNTIREISKNISILYIEDDLLLQSQVSVFLFKYFQNVDCVDSGEKALKLYEKKQYDLLIVDLKLPGMNGITLIKKIKEINNSQHIIITSVVDSTEVLRELINLGVDRFVLKPFDFKNLFKIIFKEVVTIYNKKTKDSYKDTLVKTHKLYQEILDKINISIVVFENYKIILANQEFLKFTGKNSYETIENITDLFLNKELKGLTNKEFIDILSKHEFHEIELLNKTKLIARLYKLSSERYLMTLINIKSFEKQLKQLKSNFLISEHTKLPNIFFFKEQHNIFKNKKHNIFLLLLSFKNFKALRLYFGKNEAREILCMVLNRIMDLLKIHRIDKDIFIYDFGINQYLFLFEERFEDIIKNIIEKIEKESFNYEIVKDDMKRKVSVPIKIVYDIILFDKEKDISSMLLEISDKFYNIIQEE